MTLNLLTQNLINLSAHFGTALSIQSPRTLGFPLRNPLLLKKHVSPCQLQPPGNAYAASKVELLDPCQTLLYDMKLRYELELTLIQF